MSSICLTAVHHYSKCIILRQNRLNCKTQREKAMNYPMRCHMNDAASARRIDSILDILTHLKGG